MKKTKKEKRMKTNNDYIQEIVNNILLQTYIGMLSKGGITLSQTNCKNIVKPKFPEYPAVYAHVKYGGFNIGTICIANVQGNIFSGASLCSPKDTFSKKIGRELAYERAITDKEPLDIPKEHKRVFDETYDYLVGIAERKLFGEKKFEEVKPRKENPKYPYFAEYLLEDGISMYKGLKVLFVGKNKAIVIKNSLWTSFRVGGDTIGFDETKFRKISSEEL